ncbi:MAG TPA: VWA domain-containing protein [Pyrinomonadaceae bacterium]|nr:VWA domain-containing protein [Pyrinomonadaceae bacterium]
MNKKSYFSMLLVFALICSAMGQGSRQERPPATQTPLQMPEPPPRTPQQQQSSTQADDEVVRITTNLVQVDAVVTDSQGHQVTDLRPEEFEVREDSRPQSITNFSYIKVNSTQPGTAATTTVAATPTPANRRVTVPPAIVRAEQVKRTIALVVDDLGLSSESIHFLQKSLRKFVDEQMQPGDLVAIIRTSAGAGALQQFTSDRRMLYAAIDRVHYNPGGRSGLTAFAPVNGLDQAAVAAQQPETYGGGGGANAAVPGPSAEDVSRLRGDLLMVGTLGALGYIVRGMRDLPGRKAAILFSDGIRLFDRRNVESRDRIEDSTRVLEAMRNLTEAANRASVVFYTIDARGLQALWSAADESGNVMNTANGAMGGSVSRSGGQEASSRATEIFETQDGLNFLARETGGLFIHDTNAITQNVQRIMQDQNGYYLIGYRPEESTFNPRTGRRQFHKLEIKVKRPGLQVRTRTGFYGVSSENTRPVLATREAQMYNAIISPFNSAGVNIRLTSLFGNDQATGYYVRSLLHIDTHDLTFTDDADGWKKSVMDVLALTFDDQGRVVDSLNIQETIRARPDTYERILRDGMIYSLNVPVKKPGAYQLRLAIRDAASQHVGAASQYVEVPNLADNHLALSGIVLSGVGHTGAPTGVPSQVANTPQAAQQPQQQQDAGSDGGGLIDQADPRTSPAVRSFARGDAIQYGYVIYNAQADRATNRPRLLTQLKLFRDGQEVYAGKVVPLELGYNPDLTRIAAGGGLQLGELPPGQYYLQIIVTDSLAQARYNATTQWIDFEIR